MTDESEEGSSTHLTKGRLEGLSDGIFAFAMTLLVVGISLPDKQAIVQSTGYATDLLFSLYSDFFHYFLAFLILGAFWLSHHIQLHSVRRIDKAFIWINLFMLCFVALLPFTTSFSGDFPKVPLGSIVFEANLFAIGMAMSCEWLYATHNHKLVEPTLDQAYIRRGRLGTLITPMVSVLGIIIAFTGNTGSTAVYLLLPVIGFFVNRFAK